MDTLPSIGTPVTVRDPLGYSGTGVVEAIQERPTAAIQVRMETITDRTDQSVVGRSVWFLTPYVTEKGTP